MRLLWVLGEGKLLFGGKLLSAMKFVHEMGVLCAELLSVKKFVHEMGVLCAELGSRPPPPLRSCPSRRVLRSLTSQK